MLARQRMSHRGSLQVPPITGTNLEKPIQQAGSFGWLPDLLGVMSQS